MVYGGVGWGWGGREAGDMYWCVVCCVCVRERECVLGVLFQQRNQEAFAISMFFVHACCCFRKQQQKIVHALL